MSTVIPAEARIGFREETVRNCMMRVWVSRALFLQTLQIEFGFVKVSGNLPSSTH